MPPAVPAVRSFRVLVDMVETLGAPSRGAGEGGRPTKDDRVNGQQQLYVRLQPIG